MCRRNGPLVDGWLWGGAYNARRKLSEYEIETMVTKLERQDIINAVKPELASGPGLTCWLTSAGSGQAVPRAQRPASIPAAPGQLHCPFIQPCEPRHTVS